MREKLDKIRQAIVKRPMRKKIFDTIIIFLIGLIFGLVAKILDVVDLSIFNQIFELMDLGSYFSRMSIWLLLALFISVFSKSPLRAAINAFIFFQGMLISYYIYGYIVGNFSSVPIAFFWFVLSFSSPILAILCWYAKGTGRLATFISSCILAIFFILAFTFDFTNFNLRYNGMEMINWVCALVILYNNPKQFIKTLLYSILIGVGIRYFYITYLFGKINFRIIQY